MKVIARHERDDLETELDSDQLLELEADLGLAVSLLLAAGIVTFETHDGWAYKISD